MAVYKVAQMNLEGRDLNIVPLEPTFDQKSMKEKQEFTIRLQHCAKEAGWKGRIVPVWDNNQGGMSFFGPPYLHAILEQITLSNISKKLQSELVCD